MRRVGGWEDAEVMRMRECEIEYYIDEGNRKCNLFCFIIHVLFYYS